MKPLDEKPHGEFEHYDAVSHGAVKIAEEIGELSSLPIRIITNAVNPISNFHLSIFIIAEAHENINANNIMHEGAKKSFPVT